MPSEDFKMSPALSPVQFSLAAHIGFSPRDNASSLSLYDTQSSDFDLTENLTGKGSMLYGNRAVEDSRLESKIETPDRR